MRNSVLIVLASLLVPAAALAQRPVQARAITDRQAIVLALKVVGDDIGKNDLTSWGDPHVTGLAPANIAATGTVFNATSGVIAVAVTSPKAPGHVRVLVNGRTGAVISKRVSSWDWGNSPSWWRSGLNAAPAPARIVR